MQYFKKFLGDRELSRVALGCMRIANMNETEADNYVSNAIDCGINYFDNADIYAFGRCEEVFGGVLKRNPSIRDKIILQTKCGIRNGMYDFSKEHIISSVECSLKRLGVEHIDVLLLHRPDLLMEPDEVACAFDELKQSGKVEVFGVSNHSPAQIELLKASVKQEIAINQMQLSIPHAYMISSGANVNMMNDDGTQKDGYLRDYCRLNNITVQPWSPLQYGFMNGAFLQNKSYDTLKMAMNEIAQKYEITDTGVAIAWLLRLPEKMQPIVGSTNSQRIREISNAADVKLSAEDWYKIYLAAGYTLP